MRAWFARTNSWHWLCAAVAVSALVSAFLWKGQIDRVAREARRSAKRAAAAPSAPQAAPARLSFKTEEVAYTVEGEFRDMFLFLVGETFRKPSYHLKDIAVTRPEGGATRMTFTLQANHR